MSRKVPDDEKPFKDREQISARGQKSNLNVSKYYNRELLTSTCFHVKRILNQITQIDEY